MRERKHSKSGLFLIELMISIAVFAMTTAVFIQVFVKSHDLSKEAENIFKAQNLISSAAEILEGSEDFSGDLQKYFPKLQTKAHGVQLWYDDNWRPVKKEGEYLFWAEWTQEQEMWTVDMKVSGKENKEIYGLTLKLYRPQKGGGL